MIIPDPVSVNEICKNAMKEYARNYDKCVVACMSDEVLLGMRDLIEKEIEKRGLKRLQAENEELKETNLQLQTIDMEIDRNNKYRQVLEEIREYLQQFKKKKSNFYTLNDVVTDIANNIEKIISDVLK